MPQSKEVHKEYMRKRRKGSRVHIKPIMAKGLTREAATLYSHILNWLVDPVKKEKLERICTELGKRNLLDQVFIGTNHPVDLYTINECLEATV